MGLVQFLFKSSGVLQFLDSPFLEWGDCSLFCSDELLMEMNKRHAIAEFQAVDKPQDGKLGEGTQAQTDKKSEANLVWGFAGVKKNKKQKTTKTTSNIKFSHPVWTAFWTTKSNNHLTQRKRQSFSCKFQTPHKRFAMEVKTHQANVSRCFLLSTKDTPKFTFGKNCFCSWYDRVVNQEGCTPNPALFYETYCHRPQEYNLIYSGSKNGVSDHRNQEPKRSSELLSLPDELFAHRWQQDSTMSITFDGMAFIESCSGKKMSCRIVSWLPMVSQTRRTNTSLLISAHDKVNGTYLSEVLYGHNILQNK